MQLTVLETTAASRDIRATTIEEIENVLGYWDGTRPRMTWDELDSYTGGLSAPSKMPCHGWSISAKICRTGSKLRKVKGSVCSGCYALKGRYVFPNVEAAMERRLECIRRDPAAWAAAMIKSINKTGDKFFRWHDSGDLLGVNHFRLLCEIAKFMPHVQFWLPTREKQYITNSAPANLVVRVSAPMIGEAFVSWRTKYSNTSSVNAGVGYSCPAPNQGNKCLDCRACWSGSVVNVDYTAH